MIRAGEIASMRFGPAPSVFRATSSSRCWDSTKQGHRLTPMPPMTKRPHLSRTSGRSVVAQANPTLTPQPGAWLDEADLRKIPWRAHDLAEGETITGTVVRLPERGAFCGSRVFIAARGEVVGLSATAKVGHTLLERELTHIEAGDKVSITYFGKRTTVDGEREYRHYELRRHE